MDTAAAGLFPARAVRICVRPPAAAIIHGMHSESVVPVNLEQKFAQFSDHWSPKVVGQVNDFHVKLVKLKGEFVWHHHDREDELFLVTKGVLRMKLREGDREREELVRAGEFIIVPRGVEHCPVADEEVELVLLEPATTLNTGNVESERTVRELERI
jgi:mannose-6-phosphate isomerase-like protein (cupin superfamily)